VATAAVLPVCLLAWIQRDGDSVSAVTYTVYIWTHKRLLVI